MVTAKPATVRVKLHYPDVDSFLNAYGLHITRDGVFIETDAPKPVGTLVRFELVLADGETPVLRGEGNVERVREADAPSHPAGMRVAFSRLLDDGAELVERALRMRGAEEPLVTGAIPRNDEPDTGVHALDLRELELEELGVSQDRIDATLQRARNVHVDELDSLRAPVDEEPATIAEAMAGLDALLRKR